MATPHTTSTGELNPAFEFEDEDDEEPKTSTTFTEVPLSNTGSTSHIKPEVVDSEKQLALVDDQPCGCGPCHPKFLQRFRSPGWLLFFLCWASAIQGMVVNGFCNVVITSLERRYGLSSTQTGTIASGYDIASVLIILPVSYLGGNATSRKPRWLGIGMFLLGIGSFIFALPHFVSEDYQFVEKNSYCKTNSSANCDYEGVGESPSYMGYFMVGQFLHGIGAAPLYTLGITFLDESVETERSALYVGIYYMMAVIGPAIGYVLGGQFLKYFVDIGKVDPMNYVRLTLASASWVGAWWIGFIMTGFMGMMIAIPLFSFPSVLPGSKELQAKKVSEAHSKSTKKDKTELEEELEAVEGGGGMNMGSLEQLPRAAWSLIRNPAFIFLSLACSSEGLVVSGLAAFLPKFLENQYGLAAAEAAIMVGMVTVPAGGGATFLGGFIIRYFKLRCASIIRFCYCTTFIAFGFAFCFLIYCPDNKMAGLNTAYLDNEAFTTGLFDSNCNSGCGCSPYVYDPVCGVDTNNYFSACYAGCTGQRHAENKIEYSNCSCIVPPIFISANSTEASSGKCTNDCGTLVMFLSFFVISMVGTFVTTIPAISGILRCVGSEERSFALGIQWILVRLLGTIPGPPFLGFVIDLCCVLWHEGCNEAKGVCEVYSNYHLSRYMMAVVICGKGLTTLFFFLSWLFYHPPQKSETQVNGTIMSTISIPDFNSTTRNSNPSLHGVQRGTTNNCISISENVENSLKMNNSVDESDVRL